MHFGGRGWHVPAKRDLPQAIQRLEKARSMNDSPMTRGYLAHVYGLAGEKVRANGLIKELADFGAIRVVRHWTSSVDDRLTVQKG